MPILEIALVATFAAGSIFQIPLIMATLFSLRLEMSYSLASQLTRPRYLSPLVSPVSWMTKRW